MKNLTERLLSGLILGVISFLFASCLHIVEEVTVKKDGSGSYKMTIDMREVKTIMEAIKSMGMNEKTEENVEEEAAQTDEEEEAEEMDDEGAVSQLGVEISSIATSLKRVSGLSNIKEINDTSAYIFGYSFDFANIEALNKAIRIINREKYDSRVEETFRYKGGSFERLNAANIGEQFKKSIAEVEENSEEGNMDMVKALFSEMTYKQVYRFPDAKVKKSSNPLSELSQDRQSVTILLKPMDEEQNKKKPTVATVVKLK
ncbi:MAG: hypothetical protein NZM43_04290 [Saprospiraceae bacterium]|nr:hypothetical protein [Saprospiraceae bacterium]MDW8483527.1 hypothetical protein [Saprospiraceae bacterium]